MTPAKDFITAFKALPRGGSEGLYQGRKYSLTIKYGHNERSAWLYAEALGHKDHISANLYFLRSGQIELKPCEMPAEKVTDFIKAFQPDK